MQNTYLVKDVLWQVSNILLDIAPQYTRWQEKLMVQALNNAHRCIAKYVPTACARLDAIKLTPGSRQQIENIPAANCIMLDGTSPSAAVAGVQLLDVVRNMGADGLTPGKAVRKIDRDTLDAMNPDWHTTTGTPVRSVVFNKDTPRVFYVSPAVPSSPAAWMEISYAAKPAAIPNGGAPGSEIYANSGSDTTKIQLDDVFADDLVNYCVAWLSYQDGKNADPRKAERYGAMFMASLNAHVTALTGASPNLSVFPMGGVAQ